MLGALFHIQRTRSPIAVAQDAQSATLLSLPPPPPPPPPVLSPPLPTLRLLPAFKPLDAQAAGGVNVVIKGGQAAVQLQDAFHVPLLELSLGAGGQG